MEFAILNHKKLPNFKSLGISKDMDSEFQQIDKSELQRLVDSEYFRSPLLTDRPKDGEYCNVEVIEDDNHTWYRGLAGFRFFCQIVYRDYGYGRFVQEFKGVKLTRNKMVVFRSLNPKDVMIV